MINIKALIAFINRDGNETISKQEIDDFNKTQDKVSIFGDYFKVDILLELKILDIQNKILHFNARALKVRAYLFLDNKCKKLYNI